MSTEYGLFSDEGIVEGGFYSVAEAQAAIAERYDADDGLEVEEVCPEHPDHPRCGCEKCDAEEVAEDEYAAVDEAEDEESDE
jgi:hypothetical protein